MTHGVDEIRSGRCRGLTMVEVAIAIVIGLIVLAGLGYLVYKAQSGNKQTQLSEQVGMIAQAVKASFHGQTNFSGLTNLAAIQSRDVPPGLIKNATNGVLKDAWGGTISIIPDSSSDADFDVYYTQIPQGVCINTLTSGSLVVYAVKNGSTTVKPKSGGAISIANAQTICNSASNDVYFVFS